MPELTISTSATSDQAPVPGLSRGARLASTLPDARTGGPWILRGAARAADVTLACLAAWALDNGQPIVLQPANLPTQLAGTAITPTCTPAPAGAAVSPNGRAAVRSPGAPSVAGWRVAMYTSGSTGPPRAFGFTRDQLNRLATWYATIYRATGDSVICTHLPVTYNFTYVAGLVLAHALGARLHLAASPRDVFTDARRLAREHDRCIILANPLLLADPPKQRLAANVLIDSGGAPLSTHAITTYREHVGDLREGYGLTETGSLTHFDHTADPAALGTVGAGLPGVATRIIDTAGIPRVAITTPARGAALEPPTAPKPPALPEAGSQTGSELLTTDVGQVDSGGRLRLLGRVGDRPVSGLWPRDVLDLIGPQLGTAPAVITHPDAGSIRIRLHREPTPDIAAAITSRIAERTGLDPAAVRIDTAHQRLHSDKLPRPAEGT